MDCSTEISMMSPWPETIMSNNVDKCKHFDRGYCKFKNSCTLKHYIEECTEFCEEQRTLKKDIEENVVMAVIATS